MDFHLQVSFFDPLTIDEKKPYAPIRYKAIVQEQIYISYMTKGGVSYSDTEKMTPYERKIATDFIKEMLDAQEEARKSRKKKK